MSHRVSLPRADRERLVLTIFGEPPFTSAAEVYVQITGTTTWYPATITTYGDPLVAQVYLTGPDYVGLSGVPVAASSLFRVRIIDEGETILRGGGYIALAD